MSSQFEFNSVTIAPAIELYEDLVADPDEIIELALSQSNWVESAVFSPEESNYSKNDKEIRDCRILGIPYDLDSEVTWFFLSKMLKAAGDHYAAKWGTGFSSMEHPQLLHYEAGTGHYKEHVDTGPMMPRVFSAVLYLNDVEEGGETYFKHFDFSVKPSAGNLIIFPADYPYAHAALPPISGDKFAVVTWYRRWSQGHHNH